MPTDIAVTTPINAFANALIVPTFEIATCPTISLSSIRERRFTAIDLDRLRPWTYAEKWGNTPAEPTSTWSNPLVPYTPDESWEW